MSYLDQKRSLSKGIRRHSRLCWIATFLVPSLQASQWGPVFPSHRFPTDRSFHANASLGYGAQGSFFDADSERTDLGATLSRMRFTVNPEYQPNRQLSLGAYLNFDSLKLDGDSQQLTKAGFSDQYLYGEYRVVDQIGHSIGFGTVFKVPLYSGPTDVSTGTEDFLLLGDGQIDASFLLTTEFWPWRQVRLIGDLGFTYRTDEHATEVPFQVGAEFVDPKYNVGLFLLGNLSFHNDKATQTANSRQVQALTGGTNYVYATNPETINIELKGEYSFSHAWALTGSFINSVWGKNSPFFLNFSAGISYRFFDPSERKRSAREVGIDTDDSSSDFEGELQEEGEDELIQQDDGPEDEY